MGQHDIQEFCLKWNNHHSTLVSVLDSLLVRESLVDVVLAAEGQSIKVHRLVLFACSQYFTDLLSQQTDKHAVVFLKDVAFSDLKSLVDFMYRGEVNISQYQLESFLQTAEALQIKGLADKPNQRKYMSSLVLKKPKTSENHAAADTTHQTESQSNVPCPPRLHRSKTATKKTKTLAEKKQSPQQPVESDEAPDLLDCEMDTDPTSGEQLEQEDQEGQSDQESLKDEDDEGWSAGNSQHSLSGISASGSYGAMASAHETGNETWASENGAGASETNYDLTMSDSSQYGEGGATEPVILEDTDGGDRPFSCPRCGRRYKRKNNAVAHLRYECGVVPSFPCPICSHMLSQRRYIQKHIRRKHPDYIQDYQEYKEQRARTSGDDVD
ncbi:hypothetical protein DAPPUDRAFT_327185 [Daphnia pulex]|uniref:Longitudinals lacking protein n=1 Tax=Daphnia pulex TaxID=6669 RepID=E9H9N9_DAPPU|nr:hypothetical protein DAPPUDRAFT_327185 [Daphnia pulex]|eukprot:EFX71514.1 hypothetical protein DAPPUDRAFT_327185 [Daphnia pulex]